MKLGNSLLQKGLFLVFVPLSFQLIVLGGITYLEAEAEEVAMRAEHAAKIDANINYLTKALLDNMPTWEWNSDDTLPSNYEAVRDDVLACLKRLKVLSEGDADMVGAITEVEILAHEALDLMETHKETENYTIESKDQKGRKRRFKGIKKQLQDILANRLLPFANAERRIMRESPQLQAQNRKHIRTLLFGAVAFNIVLAIVLVVFYNRDIVRRLSTIFDNSLRLASRKPLLPPTKGTDEIARLDQIFHTMADSLAEAARKEILVIENAQDMICSLDAKGTFITANPATETLLGYTPEELIGNKISNIIHEADQPFTQNNLKVLMDGESIPPFETRMVRKNKKVADTLMSAQWSATESSMFCVMHDVTERKQAERLRQEVVQMVSHDLRTPLTTIRGTLEIVASGKVGDLTEKGKNMIQMAEHSSQLLVALARDLLEIEKLEAGMLELNKMETSIENVFKQAVDSVAIIAQKRKVNVETSGDGVMFADGNRVVQILVNLITNAIKFSPPDSTVTVCSRVKDNFVEISVSDTGRGIPEAMLSSIFERFKQVRESDSKNESGSGLGLAICKALVELHGGEISVTSLEGKGSTFTFSIPNNQMANNSAHRA